LTAGSPPAVRVHGHIELLSDRQGSENSFWAFQKSCCKPFDGDTVAINLWANPIEPGDWGYPKHHDTRSHTYWITGNAFLGNHVGPRLCIIGVVVIRRHGFLSPSNTDRRHHHDEESKAQQMPTMNEAACFHVLTVS
jgi:hypothetical protein